MPDPVLPDPPPSWMAVLDKVYKIAVTILAAIAAITGYLSNQQARENGSGIQVVTKQVDTNASEANEFRRHWQTSADETHKKLAGLEMKVGALPTTKNGK